MPRRPFELLLFAFSLISLLGPNEAILDKGDLKQPEEKEVSQDLEAIIVFPDDEEEVANDLLKVTGGILALLSRRRSPTAGIAKIRERTAIERAPNDNDNEAEPDFARRRRNLKSGGTKNKKNQRRRQRKRRVCLRWRSLRFATNRFRCLKYGFYV